MEKNKTGKYLKYAIGEIILVVIGILIALQINTWNEDYKNTKKERGYLINLQQDLRADSLRLSELKNDFELAVKSKKKFEKIIEGQPTTNDSLIFYVNNQIDLLTDFVPNSSTFDELKNSNGLNLISNPQLKRQIVTLYNSYADLILKLKLGTEKSQILYAHLSKYVNNINTITSDEIHVLLNDNFFKNQMLLNYLYTQFSITLKAYGNCLETLNVINKELKHV
ncbi:DUF6090 family protein [Sediminicola arcticus]|jgi:hypothetical protein